MNALEQKMSIMEAAEKEAKERNYDAFELPDENDLIDLLINEVVYHWDKHGLTMNGTNHNWLMYQIRRYNRNK